MNILHREVGYSENRFLFYGPLHGDMVVHAHVIGFESAFLIFLKNFGPVKLNFFNHEGTLDYVHIAMSVFFEI